MSWSTIRKATQEDIDRLEASARKFAERHNINIPDVCYAVDEIEAFVGYAAQSGTKENGWFPDGGYLRRLWKGCVRRALREPQADGIAYGYVGQSVDQ